MNSETHTSSLDVSIVNDSVRSAVRERFQQEQISDPQSSSGVREWAVCWPCWRNQACITTKRFIGSEATEAQPERLRNDHSRGSARLLSFVCEKVRYHANFNKQSRDTVFLVPGRAAENSQPGRLAVAFLGRRSCAATSRTSARSRCHWPGQERDGLCLAPTA